MTAKEYALTQGWASLAECCRYLGITPEGMRKTWIDNNPKARAMIRGGILEKLDHEKISN
jgi:hypothetical protein